MWRRKLMPLMILALVDVGRGGSAMASGDFHGPHGIRGRWAAEVTIGTSVRMKEASPSLIGVGNGGTAPVNTVDDGNLNYQKGDVFSTVAKVLGELDIQKDGAGAFVRANAYTNPTLENSAVPHGASNTGYAADQTLSDNRFPDGSRFSDLRLLDAYVYAETEVLERPLTVKLGRQVVTWGESLFIQGGVNQYSNLDAAALRRPGAQLKEIFLPIPQLYFNLQTAQELSFEGFVQLNHERANIDGCGTLFSPADLLACGNVGSGLNPGALALPGANLFVDFSSYTDQQAMFGGGEARVVRADGSEVGLASTVIGPIVGDLNFKMDDVGERRAPDKGQFGVAMRYFSENLNTEFGVYAVNYHQRVPNLSLINRPTTDANSVFSGQGLGGLFGIPGLSYFFDSGSKNIQVAGVSAATEIQGVSVFGELSFTKDYPAPLNTTDLVKGASTGTGPLQRYQAQAANAPAGTQILEGSKRLNKWQAQVAGIKSFPRILGTSAVAVVGELGVQIWSGIEDPFTGERFGRSPIFGAASHINYNNGVCDLGVNVSSNKDPRFCATDGFATKTAAAYRLSTVFQYPDLFPGINVLPRVFLAHDFKGTSADGFLVEDRINFGLGLKAEIKSGKYFADVSYSGFSDRSFYDPLRDKDFLSLVLGANL